MQKTPETTPQESTPEKPPVNLKPLPIRQVVLECVDELHSFGRPANVTRVAEITGLSLRQVSEAIEGLVEAKKLIRAERGFVEPSEANHSRAVSTTAIGRHGVKIEVGDQVMTVYTLEARAIARALCGYLVKFDSL